MKNKDEALHLALDWFKCYQDKSMSRNNAEELADEVIVAIKATLSSQNELEAHWNEMRASYGAREAALEAKDEPVNDELHRLHDLLGKANALARIRANKIDELEQQLTKTEAQLGEAVWNYGEVKSEQLANQQKTSGSPINTSAALEAKDEPAAWMNKYGACKTSLFRDVEAGAKEEYTIPLYTTPPQRKPLTDEELLRLLSKIDECTVRLPRGLREFARAIEAVHGITGENT